MSALVFTLLIHTAHADEIHLTGVESSRAKKSDCGASDVDALTGLSGKAGLRLDEFLKSEAAKAQTLVTDQEVKTYLASQEGRESKGIDSSAIKSHLHMQKLIADYRKDNAGVCK